MSLACIHISLTTPKRVSQMFAAQPNVGASPRPRIVRGFLRSP